MVVFAIFFVYFVVLFFFFVIGTGMPKNTIAAEDWSSYCLVNFWSVMFVNMFFIVLDLESCENVFIFSLLFFVVCLYAFE